jgi:hypothetical protein
MAAPVVVGGALAGGLRAVYRTASRPPMRYGGAGLDTPFGLIPVDLLAQVMRGPDVVAAMVLFQLMLM